jgi:hypothetical protein
MPDSTAVGGWEVIMGDVYYVTEGDDYYHADRECLGIKRGHATGRTMGRNEYVPEPLPLAKAKEKALLGLPCKGCVGRA